MRLQNVFVLLLNDTEMAKEKMISQNSCSVDVKTKQITGLKITDNKHIILNGSYF